MKRIHNFSAGPAAMPLAVLEQARDELLDYRGTGMSVMEMSHRGPVVDEMHNQVIADLQSLLGYSGDDYATLFMGGGARTQFALVPMNLRAPGQAAHYIDTGTWSSGAIREARKLGDTEVVWSSEVGGYRGVPSLDAALDIPPESAYLHYTSNNTIYGTQFQGVPEAGKVPVVCDMSSDILSRPVDVSRFGMIYAGAQKNMGPAGVTTVIIRRDLLARSGANLPEMFSYQQVAAKNSMLNTPPVFAIYLVGLVAKYLLAEGGLVVMARQNRAKAELLYNTIVSSSGFYEPHAEPDSRSMMNVTFRIANRELEAVFVAESAAAGLNGLKGHRSVGGLRASIYNAVPPASVQALAAFMVDFASRHG